MRRSIFSWMTLALASLAGCSTTEPLGLRYGPQRDVAEQQRDAQVIDPYPLPVGGGDMTGARPLGYDAPRQEPRRVQPDREYRQPY